MKLISAWPSCCSPPHLVFRPVAVNAPEGCHDGKQGHRAARKAVQMFGAGGQA
jgi:hypothetical protein